MKPRPLNNRSDIIGLVRAYAPTKACERAIDEDRTIVLGGFTPIVGLPCWIVRVTSYHDRVWLIAVIADEDSRQFRIKYPTRIRWSDWGGNPERGHPVYDGDEPRVYQQLKEIYHGPPIYTPDRE